VLLREILRAFAAGLVFGTNVNRSTFKQLFAREIEETPRTFTNVHKLPSAGIQQDQRLNRVVNKSPVSRFAGTDRFFRLYPERHIVRNNCRAMNISLLITQW